MKHPLLSVVIPTKNRHESLIYTLEIVVKCYSNIELIVVDSSTNQPSDSFKQKIREYNCKYFKTPSSFNGVQNFNEGIKYIQGDYIIFIGDDDIITEKIGDVIKYMIDNEVHAAISTFPINYNWPGFRSLHGSQKLSGTLVIKDYSNKIRKLKTEKQFELSLKQLVSGPLNLPRIYMGIISKKLLDRTKAKYGELFGGISPDIYSSILLSSLIDEYIIIDSPFIVPGGWKSSTTAKSAAGEHKGRINENEHTLGYPNLKDYWNYNIPFIYTVKTVWAYSLIEAYKRIFHEDISDYSPLYASLLFDIPRFRVEILKSLFRCTSEGKFKPSYFIYSTIKQNLKAILNKTKRKKIRIVSRMNNSIEALEYINSLN